MDDTSTIVTFRYHHTDLHNELENTLFQRLLKIKALTNKIDLNILLPLP